MGNTLSQAKKYQVICDYNQRTLGDLEVRVGQRVKIDPRRSDDGQGWAYATNLNTKEMGWVPTNHLAKEKSIQAERSVLQSIQNSSSFSSQNSNFLENLSTL